RIDDKEIRLREPVMHPDALIIQDPTLLHQVDLFSGLSESGLILINSSRSFEELGIAEFVGKFPKRTVRGINATKLALKHVGRPLPNAALLGGFAALSGQMRFESVANAIHKKFPGKVGDANVAAAREAYESLRSSLPEAAYA
ncbi:MAG TPA: 2-oxoacid:acceptor oxidoreductase family protein, partial [Usitatibacteraceae bacterium]|nr:2-oxoacid:acceptor oxidoreductase family protein [Usitatibacteraceae bacterium]